MGVCVPHDSAVSTLESDLGYDFFLTKIRRQNFSLCLSFSICLT